MSNYKIIVLTKEGTAKNNNNNNKDMKNNNLEVLLRVGNGNYVFPDREAVVCTSTADYLRKLLSDLGKIEVELVSVTAKGYVEDSKLSTYPVLKDYLKFYVKSKTLDSMDAEEKKSLSNQEMLDKIDGDITLREKLIIMN
jgi:translation initiation factor 2 beta subunit (eIF-2beta)/eIF-5